MKKRKNIAMSENAAWVVALSPRGGWDVMETAKGYEASSWRNNMWIKFLHLEDKGQGADEVLAEFLRGRNYLPTGEINWPAKAKGATNAG